MKQVQKQQWLFKTREQVKKCDWSFWKSCKKRLFSLCLFFKPAIVPSIHPTNQQSNHPSIHPSLPPRKIAWGFWKFYLLICSPFQWIVHMYLSWIPLRCFVLPIVSLESRWQWKELKWSLSIQKCQRLVISQRLRFLIIMRCYTWQQKCLVLKLLPSIVACQTEKFIVP